MSNQYAYYGYHHYPAQGAAQFQAASQSPAQGMGQVMHGTAPGVAQAGYAMLPVGHYAAAPMPRYSASQNSSLFGLTNDRFLKGLIIGAAATYILTNDNVQRAAIKSAVKAWSMLQGGVEEMKERFLDAEAELRASEQESTAE